MEIFEWRPGGRVRPDRRCQLGTGDVALGSLGTRWRQSLECRSREGEGMVPVIEYTWGSVIV